MTNQTCIASAKERGISLIEMLASITLLGIMGASITASLSTALKVAKLTEVHFIASVLAASKVEELSSQDPIDLDTSVNEVESSISAGELDITFTRTTAIQINSDSSRTITVNVLSNSSALPINVNFTTTFALWE